MKAVFIGGTAAAFAAVFGFGCSNDSGDKKPTTYSTQKPPTQAWKAAVGDGGTLLETFDESSWDVRKISDHDLYAVSCVDNELGWAVGAQGFIGHTADGGWSWPRQTSGVTTTLRAVSFAFAADGSAVGLAAGDAGALITTQDGGQHWSEPKLADAPALRGSAVTEGASLLLAVGDGGLVARSTDRGAHFTTFKIAGAADLYDVALDASGGLALAVDSAGAVWLSRDAAKTFEREYQAPGALESISLGRTGAVASVAGPGLALLRSSDGAWTNVSLMQPLALHATLVGPHEDRVYFAGDDGALLETVDNGQSLFRVASDSHATLRSIEDLEAR
jgi:photosystem II stability/assembly factor-like uncharacterized protein